VQVQLKRGGGKSAPGKAFLFKGGPGVGSGSEGGKGGRTFLSGTKREDCMDDGYIRREKLSVQKRHRELTL